MGHMTKFNGRQDAYIDVRHNDSEQGRTVVVETNHGTYCLWFADLSDSQGRRRGNVDIVLNYAKSGGSKLISALGWNNGERAELKSAREDSLADKPFNGGHPVALVAIQSGYIE